MIGLQFYYATLLLLKLERDEKMTEPLENSCLFYIKRVDIINRMTCVVG